MDLIEIDGLRLRCVIGCRDEERRDRSDVVIDLAIGTDARPAGDSDELADAWDYRAAAKAVIADVEASACFTVEALATRIARTVVTGCQAPFVRVRVASTGWMSAQDFVALVSDEIPANATFEVYLNEQRLWPPEVSSDPAADEQAARKEPGQ